MAVIIGEGQMEDTLRRVKKYINAANETMVRDLAGERYMTLAFEDMAFTRVTIEHNEDGHELDLIQPTRVVSVVPELAPYPRIESEVKESVFLRTKKHGAISEVPLEQMMGKPDPVLERITTDRTQTLRRDMELYIREAGMWALNEAVNGGAADFSMDFSEGNITADFTKEKLQDMILRRKQNWPVSNPRDLFLVIPTSAELQLRRDEAFDNAPRILESMIRAGALEQRLEGISAIFVTDQMPVLYDSAGNMQNAGSPPTGVWKWPWQFYKSDRELKALPPEQRKGAVSYADWDKDHVALAVWLIEKQKAGEFLNQNFPPGWGPFEELMDKNVDTIGIKIRQFFNYGIPENAMRYGLNYVVRGENIILDVV